MKTRIETYFFDKTYFFDLLSFGDTMYIQIKRRADMRIE